MTAHEIDPEKLAIAMKASKAIAWPESWRAEDFAWVARQVAGTYGSGVFPKVDCRFPWGHAGRCQPDRRVKADPHVPQWEERRGR